MQIPLLTAASFAAKKHRDQRRKDDVASPYINHPLEVACLLATEGGVKDASLLTAAILHDTVEDTECSLIEIAEKFGEEVAEVVDEVTDDKSLPKAERKRLQVEHAPHLSDRAKQLKIADKISNLRDLNDASPSGWDRQRKLEYVKWGQQVVAGCRGVNEQLDRLFDKEVERCRERL